MTSMNNFVAVRTSVGVAMILLKTWEDKTQTGDEINARLEEVFVELNSEHPNPGTEARRSLSVGDWVDYPVPSTTGKDVFFIRYYVDNMGFTRRPVGALGSIFPNFPSLDAIRELA